MAVDWREQCELAGALFSGLARRANERGRARSDACPPSSFPPLTSGQGSETIKRRFDQSLRLLG